MLPARFSGWPDQYCCVAIFRTLWLAREGEQCHSTDCYSATMNNSIFRQHRLIMKCRGLEYSKAFRLDVALLCLMVPATVLYSLAAVSHAWFALPPHSFYGLWSVKFCDVLHSCQIIPALFSDEPGWYHILQVLSVVSWAGMTLALFMLLSQYLQKCLPPQLVVHRQIVISAVCIVSASAISGTLILFYVMLRETSHPQISWSSLLASISCVCELSAGLLLLQFSDRYESH